MDRFYNNEENKEHDPFDSNELYDDGYDDDDDDDEAYEEMVGQFMAHYSNKLNDYELKELGLKKNNLHIKLLERAEKIAKSNWLWYFKSLKNKIQNIKSIYEELLIILPDTEYAQPSKKEE